MTAPVMSLDVAVDKFVKLRDRREQIVKRHKEELLPYDMAMQQIEGLLLGALDDCKLTSMKAPAGTFFRKVKTSITVATWSETLAYIQANEAWDLLEARVNKTTAEQIMTDTKLPIPGVAVHRIMEVQVRRNS